jgi:hypothetical protein
VTDFIGKKKGAGRPRGSTLQAILPAKFSLDELAALKALAQGLPTTQTVARYISPKTFTRRTHHTQLLKRATWLVERAAAASELTAAQALHDLCNTWRKARMEQIRLERAARNRAQQTGHEETIDTGEPTYPQHLRCLDDFYQHLQETESDLLEFGAAEIEQEFYDLRDQYDSETPLPTTQVKNHKVTAISLEQNKAPNALSPNQQQAEALMALYTIMINGSITDNDELARWLHPGIAKRLRQVDIHTTGCLKQAIHKHGTNWWRQTDARLSGKELLGPVAAKQINEWIKPKIPQASPHAGEMGTFIDHAEAACNRVQRLTNHKSMNMKALTTVLEHLIDRRGQHEIIRLYLWSTWVANAPMPLRPDDTLLAQYAIFLGRPSPQWMSHHRLITSTHWRPWRNGMAESTVKKVLATIRSALNKAIEDAAVVRTTGQ